MPIRELDTARRALRLAREAWRPDDERVQPAGTGDPVLLLHGFCGTPRMLRPLARFVQRELGRPAHVAELGPGLDDIRDQALRAQELIETRLAPAQERIETRVAQRCDVVAYSMGGLIAAYLLKCLDQGRTIRRVVTLGTPHGGVPLTSQWPAAWLLSWCRSVAQMRPGSAFLARLARLPAPRGARLVSIAGADDLLVPPRTAQLPGGGPHNLVLPGVDHVSLITSRRVYRCVAGILGQSGARQHTAMRQKALLDAAEQQTDGRAPAWATPALG